MFCHMTRYQDPPLSPLFTLHHPPPPSSSSFLFAFEVMSSPSTPTEFKELNSDLIHWEVSLLKKAVLHRATYFALSLQPNDSENPFNFPLWRKSLICTVV